ncbi:MAG: hypothetical protein WAN86_11685 [Hyphomicrobiaceae bacterium]
MIWRTIPAILLAPPLTGVVVGAFFTGLMLMDSTSCDYSSLIDPIKLGIILGGTYGIIMMATFGLLVHYLLIRVNRTQWWLYTIIGVFGGLMLVLCWDILMDARISAKQAQELEYLDKPSTSRIPLPVGAYLALYTLGALTGMLTSLFFWLIRRPDRVPTRAALGTDREP